MSRIPSMWECDGLSVPAPKIRLPPGLRRGRWAEDVGAPGIAGRLRRARCGTIPSILRTGDDGGGAGSGPFSVADGSPHTMTGCWPTPLLSLFDSGLPRPDVRPGRIPSSMRVASRRGRCRSKSPVPAELLRRAGPPRRRLPAVGAWPHLAAALTPLALPLGAVELPFGPATLGAAHGGPRFRYAGGRRASPRWPA